MPLQYNTAVITRGPSRPDGTAGKMALLNRAGQRLEQDTLELSDLQNASNISRINEGAYLCKLTYSNTFKRDLYILENVEGRSGIRFHRGNWAGQEALGQHTDILGCILQGYGAIYDSGKFQQMVVDSKRAEEDMIRFFNKEDFLLIIQ